MLSYLRLGPLLIQLPGLALLAGIWGATNFIQKEASRLHLNAPAVLNAVMYGLVGGLVGARLVFALEHVNAYIAAPLSLLALSANALDPWGGLLLGAGAAAVYGRRRGLALRPTLDALAPGLAVFMIAVGLANLLSGNGFGAPLRAPWAVFLWGEFRHPTQIYETLLSVAVLLTWMLLRPAAYRPGVAFCLVVGLSAAARLFTEAFRGDSVITWGGFRLAQVIALLLLAAAFYWGHRWASHSPGVAPSPAATLELPPRE